MRKTLAILVIGFALAGCSSASRSAISAWGKKHKVTLYACDGHIIQQWTTSGKIENEDHSDGLYFTDDATGKLVAVQGGPIVVEVE
jgi:hypothetical protein